MVPFCKPELAMFFQAIDLFLDVCHLIASFGGPVAARSKNTEVKFKSEAEALESGKRKFQALSVAEFCFVLAVICICKK